MPLLHVRTFKLLSVLAHFATLVGCTRRTQAAECSTAMAPLLTHFAVMAPHMPAIFSAVGRVVTYHADDSVTKADICNGRQPRAVL